MVNIYCLKLRSGKYYVGKCNNFNRVEDHFEGYGCYWTQKYKPIKLLEYIINCDDYDEDKYVRIYMDRYGIDNVRGGSFVSIDLDDNIKQVITKMHNTTHDKCFKCGKYGHFGRDCSNAYAYYYCEHCSKEFTSRSLCMEHENSCKVSVYIYYYCDRCNKEFTSKYLCIEHEKKCNKHIIKYNTCFKCGKYGHYKFNCQENN